MREERDILAAQGDTLTRENESVAQATGELADELALRDEEVEQLQATQAELVEDLQVLIVAGAIKIALMREGEEKVDASVPDCGDLVGSDRRLCQRAADECRLGLQRQGRLLRSQDLRLVTQR